jgi:hypothetical protein
MVVLKVRSYCCEGRIAHVSPSCTRGRDVFQSGICQLLVGSTRPTIVDNVSTDSQPNRSRLMSKTKARAKTPTARRPWSKEDFRLLKSMARKEPLAKIADALKRTAGATRQKATNLGVSLSMSLNKRKSAKKG